jgi:hypothetical protein
VASIGVRYRLVHEAWPFLSAFSAYKSLNVLLCSAMISTVCGAPLLFLAYFFRIYCILSFYSAFSAIMCDARASVILQS